MLRGRRVPAKCCARGPAVADRGAPGSRRVGRVVDSRLCRKFRNARNRLQKGSLPPLDSIDIGLKPNLDNPAVEVFLSIVRRQFSKKPIGSTPQRAEE